MTAIHGREDDGTDRLLQGYNGILKVTNVPTAAGGGPIDFRSKRFLVAGDRPTDITNNGLVTAALIRFDGYPTTARVIQLAWHSPLGVAATDNVNTIGALVTVNALIAATAAGRITHANVAAGATLSAGFSDVFFVSPQNPFKEITLDPDTEISDIYFTGIPIDGTQPTTIYGSWLEVSVIG